MSDLERLERLEQSITQLLYEIDSNFSKCHRIITAEVLPVVEKYAENSEGVWTHSRFWKQFFEASANVSLSGYEEQVGTEAADLGDLTSGADASANGSVQYEGTSTDAPRSADRDSSFDSQPEDRYRSTTPRGASARHHNSADSPFDLTRDDDGAAGASAAAGGAYSRGHGGAALSRHMESLEISSSPPGAPPTPQAQSLRNSDGVGRAYEADTPTSSPSLQHDISRQLHAANSVNRPSQNKEGGPRAALLHRVLDSNWKVQATPMSRRRPGGNDGNSTSPTSSPPQMGALGNRATSSTRTPAKAGFESDYDDDDSSLPQMSPPVTMAFSLPPSKLLRTPAKEAAKHMVDEILRTAGAADVSSVTGTAPKGEGYTSGSGSGAGSLATRRLAAAAHATGSPAAVGVSTGTSRAPTASNARGLLDAWTDSRPSIGANAGASSR
ncbi:DASH complex subunit ask1 [Savitreella phatthalungensis]